MDIVSYAVQAPLLTIALFLTVYLVILTVAPFVIQKGKKSRPEKLRKFAVIIPAHNEEKVIRGTLRSAFDMAYPRELFDVIVVADNCIDQTAQLALKSGAIVFQRVAPHERGKGYALNWIIPQVLERLPQPGYDACIFIDADSVISKNFLEEMNISLEKGHKIIQSSDLVLDNSNSWRVQLMLVAFALQNYVRQLGKSRLGFSILLKGNGMCFSSDVLRSIKWDVESLGEDLDMGLDLIRSGLKVHFNPDPKVYAIMPEISSSATTQRIRWEGGRLSSARRRMPGLVREAIKKKNLVLLEAAVDAAFPPLAILFMGSLLCVVMNWLILEFGVVNSPWMLAGWLVVMALLVLHCLLGLIVARVSIRSLFSLLHVPKYLIWKIGVYIAMIAGRSGKGWTRTER